MSRSQRSRTLEELENDKWGPPSYDSYLVTTCHRLRQKPIGEFSAEDLRIMIGQHFGLPFLMPIAIERLREDALLSGDYYPGDVLKAVLTVPVGFWRDHAALTVELDAILGAMAGVPEELVEAVAAYRANATPVR